MREIDPIREPSEALLSSALHRLAAGSDRRAPANVGASLAHAFRQRHRRRRRARVAVALAMAASLILAVLIFSLRPQRTQNAQQQPKSKEQQVVQEQPASPSTVPQKTQRYVAVRGAEQVALSTQNGFDDAFIPLPAYDSVINPAEIRVVRMEVTGSDLMMVGAPVSAELADNRMLADFVVGADGTPYAVRLVQQ